MAFEQLDQLRSADELRSRADEVQAELNEMNVANEGRMFSEEQREQFAALKEERDEAIKRANLDGSAVATHAVARGHATPPNSVS